MDHSKVLVIRKGDNDKQKYRHNKYLRVMSEFLTSPSVSEGDVILQ